MAKVKHGDRISADGSNYVSGLIPGRSYVIGLLYTSGTGTMNAIGQSITSGGTVNTFYASDGTTALTVTATTPRTYKVLAGAPFFRFTIASASSLIAQLVVIPVGHGY
jgi:hypothetical protein